MKDILDDILDPVGGQADQVTYVCFVMDHSGSMGEKVKEDITKAEMAKSNFSEQLVALRKETDNIETRVSVIEFDDIPNIVGVNAEIRELLDTGYHKFKGYWFGGLTALYDAIMEAIDLVKKQMDAEKRKDKSALIIIQTDGQENASKEYPKEEGRITIKNEIEKLEKTGLWTFTFLGENIDKELIHSIGIKAGNAMIYDNSARGYLMANQSTIHGVKAYYAARKSGLTQTENFHDHDMNAEIKAKLEEENGN